MIGTKQHRTSALEIEVCGKHGEFADYVCALGADQNVVPNSCSLYSENRRLPKSRKGFLNTGGEASKY
jgi:hypothetical protein